MDDGVRPQMQFMARALRLLPQPAALFEIPGHRYVAANDAARHLAHQLLGDELPEDPELLAKSLEIADALAEAEYMGEGTLTYEARYGLVHISRIPPPARHPRPDLLLLTMHAHVDPADAWLDHNRMILALKINESSEISMRVLETSLQQITAAMAAQHDLVHTYNERMEDWLVRRVEPAQKKWALGY